MLDHASDVCIVCLCLPVLLVVLTEVLIGLIHLACDVCIACCCYLVLSVLCVVANHITCSVCTYLSNEVVYIPSTVIKELDFMNHHDGLFRQSTKATSTLHQGDLTLQGIGQHNPCIMGLFGWNPEKLPGVFTCLGAACTQLQHCLARQKLESRRRLVDGLKFSLGW